MASRSRSGDSFHVLVRWKVTSRRASRHRNASRPIRNTRLWTPASAAAWDTAVRLQDDSQARELLEETLGALRELGVGAYSETVHALAGHVPDAISQAGEETGADLVVLSPQRRGACGVFFSPRVGDAVSHASRIAVLLAPNRPRTRDFGDVGGLGRTWGTPMGRTQRAGSGRATLSRRLTGDEGNAGRWAGDRRHGRYSQGRTGRAAPPGSCRTSGEVRWCSPLIPSAPECVASSRGPLDRTGGSPRPRFTCLPCDDAGHASAMERPADPRPSRAGESVGGTFGGGLRSRRHRKH